MAFIETSAYERTGIDEAFTMVLKRLGDNRAWSLEIYELNSGNQLETSSEVPSALPKPKNTVKINLNTDIENEKKTGKKCC